jgi:hypothetical protein
MCVCVCTNCVMLSFIWRSIMFIVCSLNYINKILVIKSKTYFVRILSRFFSHWLLKKFMATSTTFALISHYSPETGAVLWNQLLSHIAVRLFEGRHGNYQDCGVMNKPSNRMDVFAIARWGPELLTCSTSSARSRGAVEAGSRTESTTCTIPLVASWSFLTIKAQFTVSIWNRKYSRILL